MPSRRFTTAAIVVAALALAGCRTLQPVNNISNAAYATPTYQNARVLTLNDYERAIVRAGANRGWRFSQVGPGQLTGDVTVRGKHQASVDVLFNTQTYSINYKDSQGLKYDPANGEIHPSYNSWIRLLDNEIQNEITQLRAS